MNGMRATWLVSNFIMETAVEAAAMSHNRSGFGSQSAGEDGRRLAVADGCIVVWINDQLFWRLSYDGTEFVSQHRVRIPSPTTYHNLLLRVGRQPTN
jgi:hypothetical protein